MRGGTPLWAIGVVDNNPGFVAMQGDGNFVVYDGDSQPVWALGTDGNSGAYLALLNNGRLVLFGSNGVPLWWSHSGWGW